MAYSMELRHRVIGASRCQRIAARHGEKPRAAAGGPIVDTEIS
jgi:hypothetical protein